MTDSEFELIIGGGENSRVQFKKDMTNVNSLALELIAFSNALGGTLLIGVDDDGSVTGLSFDDIQRINQLLSNAATQNTVPPVYPVSEVFEYNGRKVMIISVPYGANKPYATKDGRYVTKAGADKRMISGDEMKRLYQESGKVYAEETPLKNAEWSDIDAEYFQAFYEKKYGDTITEKDLPRAFENCNLATGGTCNLAGALLFGKNNATRLFIGNQLLCVSFFGNDIGGTDYRDSTNITGNLKTLFLEGRAFLSRNLKRVQNGKDFNTVGEPEIPLTAMDELLINALLHRDFFVSSNIRILIFDNRIEIISPGKLPNNLTVEKIKSGVSIKRNPTLCSYAFDILPYRGIGSGILRAIKTYPPIEFENNTDTKFFRVIVHRP